ncbi:MAG: hypothetical protein M1133_14810 [Armatimonadetes bacterium]|nr:hypothetical protein [Armatimonadota bacterium]
MMAVSGEIINVEQESGGTRECTTFTKADIRRNMICIVMLDSIFTMGAADLAVVVSPLWVFLGASNKVIGLANSLAITSIVGVILSPFISVRFRYKKWYLFVSHIPYIGAWGIMGVVILFARQLGLSNAQLLTFVFVMMVANFVFGGFVGLPHQEYIVGCIPMSHRGRYTGYSTTIGGVLSISTMLAARWVLKHVPEPDAFGYLYLMTWFFCQAGYVLAVFGRERPQPIERAPKPWSLDMLNAALSDRPFLRLIGLNFVFVGLLWPVFFIFVPQYALRDLHLPAYVSATMGLIGLVARFSTSSFIGHFTDKLSAKRVLPYWPLLAGASFLPMLLMRNAIGVYVTTGMSYLVTVGIMTALNPLIFGIPRPENRSGHFTFQLLLSYAANGLGPIAVGYGCDALGYIVTFTVVAALAVAMFPVTRYVVRDLSADAKDYA